MAMNRSERELRRLGDNDLAKMQAVIRGVFKQRHPDMKDIAFPVQAKPAREAAKALETSAPKADLRQRTYELLQLVREPSREEREALEKGKGLVFLPVQPKTLAQVVAKDEGYFWTGELEYAQSRPELREFVPPAMEIALNPVRLALPGSFSKPRNKQLEMIEEYSALLEREFPDAKAIMLPATAYAQADKAYKAQNGGHTLFKDFYARALDNTSVVFGRYHSDDRLDVGYWCADLGHDRVGAVPAVVFLRK